MSGPSKVIFSNTVTSCFCKWFEDYLELGDDDFKVYISLLDERVKVCRTLKGFKVFSEIGLVEFVVDPSDLLQWHDTCMLYEEDTVKIDKQVMLEFESIVSGMQTGKSLIS